MPNKTGLRKRVTERDKQKKIENRTEALDYYNNHPECGIRETSKKFGIPYSSLHDLIDGKSQVDSHVGRKTYFSMDEEDELKEWIFATLDNYIGVGKHDVMIKANAMYKIKYGGDMELTDHWYNDFKDRHPEIVKRIAAPLEKVRADHEDVETVTLFFNTLEEIINKNHLQPSQIYNCDETGIQRNMMNQYTLAKIGSHPSIVVPNQRETTSILVCGNADGSYIPPLYIYSGKSVSQDMFVEEDKESTSFAT